MKRTFFPLLVFLLFACSDVSAPENLMSEKKMISFLIDAHLGEAGIGGKGLPRDSGQVIFFDYMDELYKKHQIKAEDFRNSYNYYKNKPELFDEIYAAVVDSLSFLDGTSGVTVTSIDSMPRSGRDSLFKNMKDSANKK